MIDQFSEILSNDRVAGNTFLIVFKSPRIAAAAVPGQFVMLKVSEGNDPLLRRPFSVFRVYGDEAVSLLYKKVGAGTTLLSRVKAGRYLNVMGPLGRGFRLPGPSTFPILVSGGIGAAPLAFAARSLAGRDLLWLSGYRTDAEIIPASLLGVDGNSIRISTDDGSSGHRGMVTDLLGECLGGRPGSLEILSCGPSMMLGKVAGLAGSHGVSAQVSIETAMACGLGACQGCVVKASAESGGGYRRVCVDGPVFHAADIDWSVT